MNKVEVKIKGAAGTGKTTIAAELAEFLKRRGFNVEVFDEGIQRLNWIGTNGKTVEIKTELAHG